jgi:hypothetical protein
VVTVLFADDVPVHYGFIFLSCGDDEPDLMQARAGQQNGLCGAAVPGVLSMVTGLHTGRVPLIVEWHDTVPTLDPGWEDVVEVPFLPAQRHLALTSFGDSFEVRLPAVGSLRARYCATGMDAAADAQDMVSDDEPTIDRYLLALWPADVAPDVVVRQTSACAAYWHQQARAVPVPSAEQHAAAARDAAEQHRLATERAAASLERSIWGGRRPSPRLRDLGGNVHGVARRYRDLLDAFADLDADTQRATAHWLVRRAFEIAELDRLAWVRPALDALDRGLPLPVPFTTPQAVSALLWADLQEVVSTVVMSTGISAGGAVGEALEPAPALRIYRPSFAIPAIFSATHPDSLQALVDTFSHVEATFDDRREELITGLQARHPRLATAPSASNPSTVNRVSPLAVDRLHTDRSRQA